jgi:hypothetical protein
MLLIKENQINSIIDDHDCIRRTDGKTQDKRMGKEVEKVFRDTSAAPATSILASHTRTHARTHAHTHTHTRSQRPIMIISDRCFYGGWDGFV